jgi:hypothetical protein
MNDKKIGVRKGTDFFTREVAMGVFLTHAKSAKSAKFLVVAVVMVKWFYFLRVKRF